MNTQYTYKPSVNPIPLYAVTFSPDAQDLKKHGLHSSILHSPSSILVFPMDGAGPKNSQRLGPLPPHPWKYRNREGKRVWPRPEEVWHVVTFKL